MGSPVTITQTCGACPVQYEGTLKDGSAFYFRARYSGWRFSVGKDLDAAVGAEGWTREEHWGDGMFAAGYMPHETALLVISGAIDAYEAGEPA